LAFGGDDDNPNLELWDTLNNRCLTKLEDIHDYGISCMKLIKSSQKGNIAQHTIITGSADGYLKAFETKI